MYDLAVCLAAIRKNNWRRLYDSIVASIGDYTFELILCGPYEEGPDDMKDLENVRYIQDFGSPTRAQQISMIAAKGRYVTWAADDGWYVPFGGDTTKITLAQCIKRLDTDLESPKRCIVTRYNEGTGDGLGSPNSGMYCLNSHKPVSSLHYPDTFLIYNCAIMTTEYFKEMGGFDCRFEACPMAFCDFGARTQLDGCTPSLAGTLFECTHMPGTTGDHAPIHNAQINHDQPLYSKIWQQPAPPWAPGPRDLKLDIDNWKNTADVWIRRFGKE